MGLSAVEEDHNYCRVPTMSSECDSRLEVPQFLGQERTFPFCQKLGTPSIDFFASRMIHQIPVYMAWKRDPGSQATNALYQPWAKMFPYAFPHSA